MWHSRVRGCPAPRQVLLLGEERRRRRAASFTFPRKLMGAGSGALSPAGMAKGVLGCWEDARPSPRRAAWRADERVDVLRREVVLAAFLQVLACTTAGRQAMACLRSG